MQGNGSRVDPAQKLGRAQQVGLGLIRAYQVIFGPMYAGSCRFVPSCSTYAAEAVRRFGALRGARLAAGRLARCHPFGGRGLDPVPAAAAERQRGKGPAATLRH